MQACLSVQRHSLTTSSQAATSQAAFRCRVPPPAVRRAQQLRVRAETEAEKAAAAAEELELDNPESESARKKAEADRLRAAEKFMVIGTGEATCKNCGYEYTPTKGDPEYPISKGTQFQQLPDDWQCPTCGAEKRVFVTKQRQVAGFAENQGYGLGTNSMDENQKSLLIFGGLAFFFVLLLAGYALP